MKVVTFRLPDFVGFDSVDLLSAFPDAENIEIKDEVDWSRPTDNPIIRQGYSEGYCAMGPKLNPYQPGSHEYKLWNTGWEIGQEES